MIVKVKSVPYERKIQGLCRAPYRGYSKGCPNFNKKEGCPPQPLINEVFDLSKELYVVYTEFAVGEFAERMRQNHPEWSNYPRQWYNSRRWQLKARKEHKKEVEKFLKKHKELNINKCPEAHGVNVTELMKSIGIKLNWQWPPKHEIKNNEYLNNTTYVVSLGGTLIN